MYHIEGHYLTWRLSKIETVGSVDNFKAFSDSEAALIDICACLAVSIARGRRRKPSRKLAMHYPVQVGGIRSHLASGYVARTDHVTVGAASRRRSYAPTPHLFREPTSQRPIMHRNISKSSYLSLPPHLPSTSHYMQRLTARLECPSPPCQSR